MNDDELNLKCCRIHDDLWLASTMACGPCPHVVSVKGKAPCVCTCCAVDRPM
jgi:hypothetical protein